MHAIFIILENNNNTKQRKTYLATRIVKIFCTTSKYKILELTYILQRALNGAHLLENLRVFRLLRSSMMDVFCRNKIAKVALELHNNKPSAVGI